MNITTLQNREVAQDLGLSESGVSRLRSGDRKPSLQTMQYIEDRYHWPMQDQSQARREGAWADHFEVILQHRARARGHNANA